MFQNKIMPKWFRDLMEMIMPLSHSRKPIVRTHRRIGRNELCRCGCGRKYKYHLWASDVKNGVR